MADFDQTWPERGVVRCPNPTKDVDFTHPVTRSDESGGNLVEISHPVTRCDESAVILVEISHPVTSRPPAEL